MDARCNGLQRTSFVIVWILLFQNGLVAQQSMKMPGVENSVGYLSSGTSIQPKTTSESSPMVHKPIGDWTLMLHANAFLVGLQQTGPRGGDKLFAANWVMPMISRQFGRQGLTFRTMLSFEPMTVTGRRYPLLFQTGETAFGFSIVNGQHPHDLVMELAGRYDVSLNERSQVFFYGGPVAEAALGPTAFPHRASASENPLAVLGHHQQDSTHIATNVLTVGVAEGPFQLEASTFHGREPDENRWNIGSGKPDSFVMRLSIAPYRNLSGQFSSGRINAPEASDPEIDTVRTTSSMHHNLQFSAGHISSSVIWGRNKNIKAGAPRRVFNSYNLEITSKFRNRNWVWTRIENVDRDQSLLPIQQQEEPACRLCGIFGVGATPVDSSPIKRIQFNHVVPGPGGVPVTIEEEPIGRVQAYTLGYARELPMAISWLSVAIGVQATTYGLPSRLESVYGRPATVAMFLRLRPTGNMGDHMRLMHR